MKRGLKLTGLIVCAALLTTGLGVSDLGVVTSVYAADAPVMDDIPIDDVEGIGGGQGGSQSSNGSQDSASSGTSKVDGIQIGPDANTGEPESGSSGSGGTGSSSGSSGGSDEIPTIVLEPDYSKVEVPKPAPQPQKPAQTTKPAQSQTQSQTQKPAQTQSGASSTAGAQKPAQGSSTGSVSETSSSSKSEETSSSDDSSKAESNEQDEEASGEPKVEISESDWVDIKVSDTLIIERGNRFMKPLAMVARSDFSVTDLYASDLLDKLGAPGGSNKTDR